jgi:protein-L-isoaspartate O-methyltransferase
VHVVDGQRDRVFLVSKVRPSHVAGDGIEQACEASLARLKAGGRMVIPVVVPEAQQLVVAQKDLSGRVTIKEVMPVRFSLFEGNDEPAFRAS